MGDTCADVARENAVAGLEQRAVFDAREWGGVMQHARLFPLIRARTQHWLGGYIARHQVETGIDDYIVAPGLDDRSGILGALLMAVESDR